MRICKTSENLTIVIDSFMFVIFVTPDVECTARNILECIHNIITKAWKWEVKEKMKKLWIEYDYNFFFHISLHFCCFI